MVCAMLNQTNNILKTLFIAFAGTILATGCDAYTYTELKTGWNSGGNANSNTFTAKDAILAGCASDSFDYACYGTTTTSGEIIMDIARSVDGDICAYFCGTQISVDWAVGFAFYTPMSSSCKWLCKPGYKHNTSGWTSSSVKDDGSVCGTTDFNHLKSVSMRKGSTAFQITGKIPVFSEKVGANDTSAEFLAIVAWYEHGALVSKVNVTGQYSGGRYGYRWIKSVVPAGSEKFLLCDMGYQPNASKTDCEPIAPTKCGMPPAGYDFCNGWSEADYKRVGNTVDTRSLTAVSGTVLSTVTVKSQTQKLKQDKVYTVVGEGDNACIQYRCQDESKGFLSSSDRTCITCNNDPRKGVSELDGTCMVCKLGEYFDKNDMGEPCKSAVGLTKMDLQYGIGMDKRDKVDVRQQCWTKLTPDTYRECVFDRTESVSEDDQSTGEVNNILSNPSLTTPQKITMLEKLRGFSKDMDVKLDKAIQTLNESQN